MNEAETPVTVPSAGPNYVLLPSRIHGTGAFLARRVLPGESIGVSHTLGIRSWEATELGRFHNHSKQPTASNHQVERSRYLVANRTLEPGDEVTVDYTLQPDLEQPRAGWH